MVSFLLEGGFQSCSKPVNTKRIPTKGSQCHHFRITYILFYDCWLAKVTDSSKKGGRGSKGPDVADGLYRRPRLFKGHF